jgi:hypothetical protein
MHILAKINSNNIVEEILNLEESCQNLNEQHLINKFHLTGNCKLGDDASLFGQGFRTPKTDIFGAVWVTGINQVSVIQNSKLINVSIAEIDKQNIIDVIPSPDGVRVAVIANTFFGSELRLGTIVRDEQSIKINYLRKVVRDGFGVSNATWQDEITLLYLDSSQDLVNINAVDTFTGLSKTLYSESGVTSIAGIAKKPLFLSLESSVIAERVSGSWVERGNLINPTYPG